MMKYCPKCGSKCEDTDTFCMNCGYEFKNHKSNQTQTAVATKTKPKIKYKECKYCRRMILKSDEKCPYCSAEQNNYYYANYCVHCGKRVHRFLLHRSKTPDSQGDTAYFICPYCKSKQGWHCSNCHQYNDITSSDIVDHKGPYGRTGGADELLCHNCSQSNGRSRCARCGTPMALNFNYCPHCGSIRDTKWQPYFQFFCTKHPYILASCTILMSVLGILDNVLSREYSSTYIAAQVGYSVVFAFMILCMISITKHHCPVTAEFVVIGITYAICYFMANGNLTADTPQANVAIDFALVPELVVAYRIFSIIFLGKLEYLRSIFQWIFY